MPSASLDALATKVEHEMRLALLRAFRDAQDAVKLTALQAAVAASDHAAIYRLLHVEQLDAALTNG